MNTVTQNTRSLPSQGTRCRPSWPGQEVPLRPINNAFSPGWLGMAGLLKWPDRWVPGRKLAAVVITVTAHNWWLEPTFAITTVVKAAKRS